MVGEVGWVKEEVRGRSLKGEEVSKYSEVAKYSTHISMLISVWPSSQNTFLHNMPYRLPVHSGVCTVIGIPLYGIHHTTR